MSKNTSAKNLDSQVERAMQDERNMPSWLVRLDSKEQGSIQLAIGNNGLALLIRGVNQQRLFVERQASTIQVSLNGQRYQLERRQPPDVETAARSSGPTRTQKALVAPMAGTIVKVQAQDGQAVEAQQVLVVLSAMKMEHTITAPYAGKVRRVAVQEGDVVKGGAIVVEME